MDYVLDFGSANAGGSPTFSTFIRSDTKTAVAAPSIVEISDGLYYFVIDWATVPYTGFIYKATLAGVELEGVETSPSAAVSASAVATAAGYSTSGLSTVGPLVARAAIQCNLIALSRAQVAAYDPFASTDPEILRLLEILDTLGIDLASKVKAQLHREFTITTAASATSYALPADYSEMVPGSVWDRGNSIRLLGPATPQRAQALKAWVVSSQVRIDHRIQGNRLTFPVAPSNGLTIAGEYVSRNWIQTAASGTGPDSDHVTLSTDYVLFDPTLVVLGLKAEWLASKGYGGAALALAKYEERLDWAMGAVGDAPILDMSGSTPGVHFIDDSNLPETVTGI